MTFTERLREMARAEFAICPTCGREQGTSSRRVAAELGISRTMLWKFLTGQNDAGPKVTNALIDYFFRKGRLQITVSTDGSLK